MPAGLYIVTAGTDGLVAVWADEGKACIAKRKCATPVAAASWHPTDNALALQVWRDVLSCIAHVSAGYG